MADATRLAAVGIVPPAAAEIAKQIREAAGATTAVDWASITGKPATFPATVPVARATLADTATKATTADSAAKATTADSATSAASATKLATARTIALSGAATGSTTFDGTAGVSIATTLVPPTATVRGGVIAQAAEAQLAADAAAAAIVTKVNALLTKLKAAGVLL